MAIFNLSMRVHVCRWFISGGYHFLCVQWVSQSSEYYDLPYFVDPSIQEIFPLECSVRRQGNISARYHLPVHKPTKRTEATTVGAEEQESKVSRASVITMAFASSSASVAIRSSMGTAPSVTRSVSAAASNVSDWTRSRSSSLRVCRSTRTDLATLTARRVGTTFTQNRTSVRHTVARPVASATSAGSQASDAIKSSNVMVFSTSTCPYCMQVKTLFSDLGVEYKAWNLDQIPNGQEIRVWLLKETGQRTVPNVFIGGKHVGGCDGKSWISLLGLASVMRLVERWSNLF